MRFSILSSKKKLGFVSLIVLASYALSQPGFAMDMEVEGDESGTERKADTDPGSKNPKKRNATDQRTQQTGNTESNKRQKSENAKTLSPPLTLSSYSGQGPRAMDTPAAAGLLVEMGEIENDYVLPPSSALSGSTNLMSPILIPTPVNAPQGRMTPPPTTAPNSSATMATATAVPPQGTHAETPAAQNYLSLEQIQDYIKQATKGWKCSDDKCANDINKRVLSGALFSSLVF